MTTFEVGDRLRVDVRVTSGQVVIERAAAGTAEVELVPDGAAGRELVDRAEVALRAAGNGVQWLVVHVPREGVLRGLLPFTSGLRGGVSVTIRCPEGTMLDARTGSADVRVDVGLATADLAAAHGDLTVDRVQGAAALKTASGSVRASQIGGALSVDTGAGPVDVGRVDGPLRVRTASGDVRIGAAAGDVRVTAASGDVRLERLERGEVSVVATAGDVDLAVAPERNLVLDLSSVVGAVRSELEHADPVAPGATDLAIRARTTAGDVTLRRAALSATAG